MTGTAYLGFFLLATSLLLSTEAVREENTETNTSTQRTTWFIAGHGDNSSECGRTLDQPCKSVLDVFEHLGEEDTIHLASSEASTQGSRYFSCDGPNIKQVGVSFTMSGLGKQVKVTCVGTGSGSNIVRFENTEPEARTITMRNLHFENIDIFILGFSLLVEDCQFDNSTLRMSTKGRPDATVFLYRNTFEGHSFCGDDEKCVPTGRLDLHGNFSDISVEDSSFYQTRMTVDMQKDGHAHFTHNVFANTLKEPAVVGGLMVKLGTKTYNTTVKIADTSFTNLFNWSPVDSVMNIFESALLVRILPMRGLPILHVNNDISVTLDNVSFHNNERALTLQGPLQNVYVDNSRFTSNIAMHAGAGILLLTDKNLYVRNSTFADNAAGRLRVSDIREPGDFLKVMGDEVQINSKKCKGSITLIGKGGAIRAQKGNVILDGCKFQNNTARILGGTVFVDRKSNLSIWNCHFINTDTEHLISQQGDIIYSNGRVELAGARLNVQSASNHISLLQHSGEHWSIAVYDVTIDCPIGHRLRVMNTSAFRVIPFTGLKRSYLLDQLSYFCESCPRHRYSMGSGYLLYQLDRGVLDYFTLMINGQHPKNTFHGNYIFQDITCKDCPYGGNCDNLIRALPNFWGYDHEDNIKFQMCPKGYCCSQGNCVTHNACAAYRTGRLCGECVEGYSEALFSPTCVSNELCGPIWLWPFIFGTGVLYAVLLFFQKDIREFIFSKAASASGIGCGGCSCSACCGKSERYTYRVCERDAPLEDAPRPTENGNVEDGESIPLKDKKRTDSEKSPDDKCPDGPHDNGTTACNDARADNETPAEGGKDNDSQKDTEMEKDNANNSKAEEEQPPPPPTTPSATDIGAILLIIVLYYFQDARLFNVKTANSQGDSKNRSMLKTVLLGLFQFRLELAQFVDNVCLFSGLTASQKLLAKTVLVPYVLLMFGIVYIFYELKTCVAAKCRPQKESQNPFLARLSTGFMLSLLFTYQRMAQTTFALLNCVPVGDDNVLFIEGGVTCYETWQYGVVAYAISCIVPFSFTLMLGPGLLQEGKISLAHFFVACLFPLPFVIGWAIMRLVQKNKTSQEVKITPSTEVVIKVLQGPFRNIETKLFGPICWAGVLIFRRLILVILFTFINTSLIRVISMLFVCFLILLNHVYVQPYKDSLVNVAGSGSVSALMIIGGINLVRAGFEAAEYVPQGPNEALMYVMHETENVLMLWFPLVIMSCIGMALVIKIICSFVARCR